MEQSRQKRLMKLNRTKVINEMIIHDRKGIIVD